jgi:hypothetical protein
MAKELYTTPIMSFGVIQSEWIATNMYIDTYGFIIMEQSALPGGYGDSCAETSRYVVLAYINGKKLDIDLRPFVTEKGVLRHPDSPWREDDTSSDQVYPLIAAGYVLQPVVAYKAIKQIADAGDRTGNSDKINIGMYAQIARFFSKDYLWVRDLTLVGQALIFKIPFRWSDSKKRLERSSGSSSDYLNFINGLAFARINKWTWPCWLATKIISKEKAMSKVSDYYKPEPNSDWLLQLYTRAIPKIWQ